MQLSASKTRIVDLFKRMDKNQDGILSRRELRLGLKAEGYVVTAAQFKAIMAALDKDFSGEISLKELNKGINWAVKEVSERGLIHDPYEVALEIFAEIDSGTRIIDGKQITDVRTFYKAIDRDGNGALDISEMARGIRRLGISAADSTILDFVKAVDSHGNGNGLIGMKELAEALTNPTLVFGSSGPGITYAKMNSDAAARKQQQENPSRSISPLGQAQAEPFALSIDIPESPSPSGRTESVFEIGRSRSANRSKAHSAARAPDAGVAKRFSSTGHHQSNDGLQEVHVDLALSPSSLSSVSPSLSPNSRQQRKSSSTTLKRPTVSSPRLRSNASPGRSSIPGRNGTSLAPKLEALNVDVTASPGGAHVGSTRLPGRNSFSYAPGLETLKVEIPTSPESISGTTGSPLQT